MPFAGVRPDPDPDVPAAWIEGSERYKEEELGSYDVKREEEAPLILAARSPSSSPQQKRRPAVAFLSQVSSSRFSSTTVAIAIGVAIAVATALVLVIAITMVGSKKLALLLVPCAVSAAKPPPAQNDLPGAADYTVPAAFPTSIFDRYYVKPGFSVEPQPVIYDPVLRITYPEELTNPKALPTSDNDRPVLPSGIPGISGKTAQEIVNAALAEITSLIHDTDSGLTDNCSKCVAALAVGQLAVKAVPELAADAFVQLCTSTGFQSASSCQSNFASDTFGSIWTQVLALADVTGLDGKYICNQLSGSFCPTQGVDYTTNIASLFPKPKPANPKVPKASGKTVKVLHLSDFHLDARYDVGAEGNCASGLCCRDGNTQSNNPPLAAPLYGAYR